MSFVGSSQKLDAILMPKVRDNLKFFCKSFCFNDLCLVSFCGLRKVLRCQKATEPANFATRRRDYTLLSVKWEGCFTASRRIGRKKLRRPQERETGRE